VYAAAPAPPPETPGPADDTFYRVRTGAHTIEIIIRFERRRHHFPKKKMGDTSFESSPIFMLRRFSPEFPRPSQPMLCRPEGQAPGRVFA
jgi:hypothetical protein